MRIAISVCVHLVNSHTNTHVVTCTYQRTLSCYHYLIASMPSRVLCAMLCESAMACAHLTTFLPHPDCAHVLVQPHTRKRAYAWVQGSMCRLTCAHVCMQSCACLQQLCAFMSVHVCACNSSPVSMSACSPVVVSCAHACTVCKHRMHAPTCKHATAHLCPCLRAALWLSPVAALCQVRH